MGVADQYTNELRQQFGYRATWLPNVSLDLGLVGRINSDGSFQRTSSLSERNIGFAASSGPGTSDYSYSSKSGVSISFKASGQAPTAGSVLGQADAGCTIGFSQDSGVVFAARACSIASISNLDAVTQDVLASYASGTWQEDEVLVTDVVTADTASIFVAQTQGAKVELRASGTLQPGTPLGLASVDADFQAAYESGLAFTAIASHGLTVLYKVSAIRKHFFSPPTFQLRSSYPVLGDVYESRASQPIHRDVTLAGTDEIEVPAFEPLP